MMSVLCHLTSSQSPAIELIKRQQAQMKLLMQSPGPQTRLNSVPVQASPRNGLLTQSGTTWSAPVGPPDRPQPCPKGRSPCHTRPASPPPIAPLSRSLLPLQSSFCTAPRGSGCCLIQGSLNKAKKILKMDSVEFHFLNKPNAGGEFGGPVARSKS